MTFSRNDIEPIFKDPISYLTSKLHYSNEVMFCRESKLFGNEALYLTTRIKCFLTW